MDRESTQVNKALRAVYGKAVLVAVTLVLLLSVLVFFTVAWYTKMVSVSGMNFQAAQWDFTANFAIDQMVVSVYDYSSLSEDHAAPGALGYIPITLRAIQSDTDIQFTIQVDRSGMSEEFQERIFFFYYKLDENGDRIQDENGQDLRFYFQGSPTDPTVKENMVGVIEKGQTLQVQVCWEWLYEAPESATDEQKLAWDEFDTQVGLNPELYAQDMYAKISIAGVEVNPQEEPVVPEG